MTFTVARGAEISGCVAAGAADLEQCGIELHPPNRKGRFASMPEIVP